MYFVFLPSHILTIDNGPWGLKQLITPIPDLNIRFFYEASRCHTCSGFPGSYSLLLHTIEQANEVCPLQGEIQYEEPASDTHWSKITHIIKLSGYQAHNMGKSGCNSHSLYIMMRFDHTKQYHTSLSQFILLDIAHRKRFPIIDNSPRAIQFNHP